jgi:uncharacterized protein
MDDRVIEFVRGMRAAGVRISLAESMDAMRAMQALGVTDKEVFKASMRATLIKEMQDFAVFDQLFPLYFGSGGPMLQNALEELGEGDQEMLQAALGALSGRMQSLLDWLMSGQGPTKESWRRWPIRPGRSGPIIRVTPVGCRGGCCSRWVSATWSSSCRSCTKSCKRWG